jgi:hypothetical protein
MPDLSGLVEALRQGFSEIPPVVIAIALLAGPTAAMIGYRMFHAARRLRSVDETQAAPYWVCHDCRSINALGHSRCYHCHEERDRQPELEVIVEQPIRAPGYFATPVGSPFAALGQAASTIEPAPGVPVMEAHPVDPVAVGPGRPAESGVTPAEPTSNELAPAASTKS